MAKLSNINGKFAVEDTGAIRFSDQTGTTGQILKSNGNSAPTWVDPNTVGTGPWLPLAGGVVSGPTTFQSSLTVGGTLTVNAGTYHKVIATFPATYTTNLQIGQQFNLSNNALTDTVTFAHTGTEAVSDFIFTVAGNEKLKIQGDGRVTFGPDAQDIQIDPASTNSGNNLIYMRGNASDDKSSLQMNHFGYADYYIGVGHVGNGKFNIANDLTGNDFVIDTSGNVGIGTTSPSDYYADQLVVKCSSSENGITIVSNSTTDANYLMFADGTSGADRYRGQVKYNHQDNYMSFATDATERMVIDSSGNTTITTTSNQGGLTVTSATDNTVLGINNTATGGQNWRLQSIGGGSGSGQGKLLMKVGGGETAANLISFVTDGSGANIKMGIGIISPVFKLDIRTSTPGDRAVLGVNSATSGTNYGGQFNSQGSGATKNIGLYATAEGATTNYAGIFDSGNVGIGTTSPSAKLTIGDPGGATTRAIQIEGNNSTSGVNGTIGSFANGLYISNNYYYSGAQVHPVSTFGQTNILQQTGTGGPGDNYIDFNVSDHTDANNAPDTRMRILDNGNVGIGTTTPVNFTSQTSLTIDGTSIGRVDCLAGGGGGGGMFASSSQLQVFSNFGVNLQLSSAANIDFVTGSTDRMHITSGGRVTIKNKPNSGLGYDVLISLGTGADGDVGYQTLSQLNTNLAGASDIRFKKNIEIIPNAIEKIKTINGYTFDWDSENEDYNYSEKESRDAGVIAQEIQKVLPEIVQIATVDRDEEGKSTSGKNYLSVDYKKIIPLLIQGIKEQETSIQELKARIKILENK